ncbi:unnamed protein product [Cylicocyclus nassatus]|uniref:Thiolase C-terminal domain-containing protein n=1 Tax=Cylicocyclus nassatus TaxID=53992 RepID=A0AA36GMY3_CYLNA|nr:unnamed protein product [Cylicocyclus nassatus]
MTTGMGMLTTGNAKAIIAGGVELLSDVPIGYNRKARRAMLSMQKAKALGDRVKLGTQIVRNLFSPELTAVAEYSSGEKLGHSGDRECCSIQRFQEYVAQDPKDQLLLSPAYVIPQLLKRVGLGLNDVDVFEIHEAFARQVLANVAVN